jgi:hypothetical protein
MEMMTMTAGDTTRLLSLASMIGAVDVPWFHHHRFNLYRRPSDAV